MQMVVSRLNDWCRVPTTAAIVAVSSIVLFLLGAAAPGLSFPFSFDEAYNLALAQHLAISGQYGIDIYGTPLRWFDPYVTTGPPVIFPLALVMGLFGTDTSVLRAVLLLFLALFLTSAYLAARWQSGRLGGAITVTLFGVLSYDLYDLGLRVLGEVPSLAFLFLAIAALSRLSNRWWCLSGAFLAVALLTKPQMVIAVAACFVVLTAAILSHGRTAFRLGLQFVAGFTAPILAWNLYQVATVGTTVWFDVNMRALDVLLGKSGAGKRLAGNETLVAAALLLSALSVFVIVRALSIRNPRLAIHRLLARMVILLLVCAPLLVTRWELIFYRLSYHWHDHGLETAISFYGILGGFVVGLRRFSIPLLAASSAGLLFIGWYFGISEQDHYRYSMFWRAIGFVGAGITLDAFVTFFDGKLASFVRSHYPKFVVPKRASLLPAYILVVSVIGLLLSHNVPKMLSPMTQAGIGPYAAAQWLIRNTPSNAIILGSGWWLPWEARFVTGLRMADVNRSVLNGVADLQSQRYLVIYSDLIGKVELAPDVVNVMRRPELLLFESHGTSIFRWPEAPFSWVVKDVESTDVDLLPDLSSGQTVLTPPPKEGILDQNHGNFIYPMNRNMMRGLTMISPSEIRTRDLKINARQGIFFGYSPPVRGDGLFLKIYASDGSVENKIWSEYVPVAEPSPDSYRVRLVSLSEYAGRRISLTVKVSSEATGDAISDWLFIGPLAIVSQK